MDPVAAYDYIATVFAFIAEQRRAYLDAIDALVIAAIPPGSRSLLDVGAGDGSRSRRIADAAGIGELTLLEPSAGMRRDWPAGVNVWTIRAEELHSMAGEFDVITCLWNVLGHIFPAANRSKVLRQFARLIPVQGRIFVDVNYRYNASHYGVLPTVGRMIYDRFFPGEENGDVAVTWNISGIHCVTTGHVFTHQEFCLMARGAGLTVEKRYVIDYSSGALRRRSFQGHLLYVLRRE